MILVTNQTILLVLRHIHVRRVVEIRSSPTYLSVAAMRRVQTCSLPIAPHETPCSQADKWTREKNLEECDGKLRKIPEEDKA